MDEVKLMRAYNKHSDMAMLILKKEGREKLEWLTAQIARQLQNYSLAANSSNQSGGVLSRLAQGASASKVEKLKPKLQAYADVLRADTEALSQFEDMIGSSKKAKKQEFSDGDVAEATAIIKATVLGFEKVAQERGEVIPPESYEKISMKFVFMQRQVGADIAMKHLQYELQRYRQHGLRQDYL